MVAVMGAGTQRWWLDYSAACDEFDGVASRTYYEDREVVLYINGARTTYFKDGSSISQGPTFAIDLSTGMVIH
jgi:hypothetical protein